jgi:hypothetical protein
MRLAGIASVNVARTSEQTLQIFDGNLREPWNIKKD